MTRSQPRRPSFLAILSTTLACVLGSIVLFAALRTDAKSDARSDAAEPVEAFAREITPENVYEHEKAWPAIVALTREWSPPGEESVLQKGYQGALVRVTRRGDPRIDFGRHGKHVVPSDRTDLVEAANAVSEGRAFKGGPNFLRQVGTRLVDSRSEDAMRALKTDEVAGFAAYLCVFANPRTEDFSALAGRLARATADSDIQPILFPQAVDREDLVFVKERLAAVQWRVPFAYPHLSGDYTRSILGDEAEIPAVLLVSPEGRILYAASLDDDVDLGQIRAALES